MFSNDSKINEKNNSCCWTQSLSNTKKQKQQGTIYDKKSIKKI